MVDTVLNNERFFECLDGILPKGVIDFLESCAKAVQSCFHSIKKCLFGPEVDELQDGSEAGTDDELDDVPFGNVQAIAADPAPKLSLGQIRILIQSAFNNEKDKWKRYSKLDADSPATFEAFHTKVAVIALDEKTPGSKIISQFEYTKANRDAFCADMDGVVEKIFQKASEFSDLSTFSVRMASNDLKGTNC